MLPSIPILSDVTAEDRRLRFFGPIREVSHELLDKLIHYDPACAMAFIAVDEKSRKMLGVVRLHDDRSGQTAEFAILVRSRLKDHGAARARQALRNFTMPLAIGKA
jgi:acetyltransferase